MSKNVCLDTSVIIDFIRRKDKQRCLYSRLVEQEYDLSISIIVHTELFSGKSVWKNKQAKIQLGYLLNYIDIIGINEEISMKAGEIRSKYDTDLFDAIIASTAMKKRLPLVTLNNKHFRGIKGLDLFDSKFVNSKI